MDTEERVWCSGEGHSQCKVPECGPGLWSSRAGGEQKPNEPAGQTAAGDEVRGTLEARSRGPSGPHQVLSSF